MCKSLIGRENGVSFADNSHLIESEWSQLNLIVREGG